MSKVVKSGVTQAVFSDDQSEFFTSFLRKVAPETAHILETTVAEIRREAERQWPVRQSSGKSKDERLAVRRQIAIFQRLGYPQAKARAAANSMLLRNELNVTVLSEQQRAEQRESTSQHSIDRFRTNIIISPNGQVTASVSNDAPYAWSIKMGIDSRTRGGSPIFLPLGSRISNELLWKPAKKEAKKIADVVAEEITKLIDRS
jgi:hypothetical protein